MYNNNITPSITQAKFTKLMKDVSSDTWNAFKLYSIQLFDNYISLYITQYEEQYDADGALTKELWSMIMTKYRYYEINDNDEQVWLQCMKDIFDEYRTYYLDVAFNYYRQFNIDLSTKRIVERNDSSVAIKDGESTYSADNDTKTYDLPHRQVDDPTSSGYMTDKTVNTDSSTTSDSSKAENAYNSKVETTNNRDFISLKTEYLSQIRNLISEFAERFSDCFIQIYG